MITEALAQFVRTATPTEGCYAMMRLSLFDWAVCAVAGRDEPVAQILRKLVAEEGGAPQASVVGLGGKLSARQAALVNGTVSHALDYDDTHFAHVGHPSVTVVPTAIALAEKTGAPGTLLLKACVIGAETSIRVGRWLGRGHYDAGFHQTATSGAFGAVAAASRILRLNEAQIGNALGIVATRAAGLKSQFGTMAKPYHAGAAAALGVEAALLAEAGFTANAAGLDCAQGFAATHAAEQDAAALHDLDEAWTMIGMTHKFHACCHGTHAMIEALLETREQVRASHVEHVQVRVHPSWLSVCNIAAPRTGLESKFSFKLIAAMVLDGWDTAEKTTFSDAACQAESLLALRDKVEVVADDALPMTAAQIVIRSDNGTQVAADHDLADPIAMPERAMRLRGKARSLLGDAVFAPMWEAITAADSPDISALSACLAAAGQGKAVQGQGGRLAAAG